MFFVDFDFGVDGSLAFLVDERVEFVLAFLQERINNGDIVFQTLKFDFGLHKLNHALWVDSKRKDKNNCIAVTLLDT